MKVKILGAHQHLNSQPTYDEQGRTTGTPPSTNSAVPSTAPIQWIAFPQT